MSTMKMPQELKDKWVAALESGEYRQGKGELGDADSGFCCLGLLCEVSGIEYDCAGAYPTRAEYEEMGVVPDDSHFALHADTTFQGSLAARNDEGESFADIAKIIREQVEVI